ncbi:extracellular solute-binding protein [Paenibacillus sp. LHD-117]|uniref:extracellular solute-binding protein n=1 Tax=Paenibacillus sp. LHD-117 TaxID=3071412 RepID=UPI0027E0DFAE|nr:extracellular solute-binding protein [Paenibacillus sp. LHD-117]MDQ6418416.1 extracellular solute-binding protein [Paenibacillus sp. LHD-117]
MKKMKQWTVITLVFLLMFALSACAGGNEKPAASNSGAEGNDGKQPVEETNKPTEETPEEETKINLAGREILFSAWWDGTPNAETPEGEAALQRQKEVEEKYNVKIKYVNQDYHQTAEKLSSTVMAGKPFADVVLVPDYLIAGLLAGGYFTALDDFMDVRAESKLPDAVIEAGSYHTSKTYGFNRSLALFDNTGLYYNKRIFEEAGLPSPTEVQKQGTWTWDTFIDYAKKLTLDTNGDGKQDQWGIAAAPNVLGLSLIYSNDTMAYDEKESKFLLDSPNAIEGLDMMNKLYNEFKVVKRNEGNDWEDPAKYFKEGKTAMYPGGIWEAGSRFQNQMKDEYVFVHFPKGPKADNFKVGMSQFHMSFIPKGVENPKVVYKIWEELQDWNVEESDRVWAETYFLDEDSVNSALETLTMMEFGRYNAYNFEENFNPLANDIAAGKITAATGVAQIMPVLQAKVEKFQQEAKE